METAKKTKSVSYVDTNALASCKGQIKSASQGIKTITDILLSKSLAALKELQAALKKCEELGLSEVIDIYNGGLRYTDDNGTHHGYTIYNLVSDTEADLEANAFNLLRDKCTLQ